MFYVCVYTLSQKFGHKFKFNPITFYLYSASNKGNCCKADLQKQKKIMDVQWEKCV